MSEPPSPSEIYVDILSSENGTTVPTLSTITLPPKEDSEEGRTISDIPEIPVSPEHGLEEIIDRAKKDLAGRLSISVEQIEVLEATSVVWPDASIGCPQPEMSYKQVPVDGALIRLKVEVHEYNYHSGGSRGLFLCE
jgi:hypothetical protein